MPRRAASVTQADIARAVRALRAAGVRDVRVVFRPEGLSVEPANDDPRPAQPQPEPVAEEREPWIM